MQERTKANNSGVLWTTKWCSLSSFDGQYSFSLRFKQHFFSHNPEADKLRGLQAKVDEIKDVMHENVGTFDVLVDYRNYK